MHKVSWILYLKCDLFIIKWFLGFKYIWFKSMMNRKLYIFKIRIYIIIYSKFLILLLHMDTLIIFCTGLHGYVRVHLKYCTALHWHVSLYNTKSSFTESSVFIQVITRRYVSPEAACASPNAACIPALCRHCPYLQVSKHTWRQKCAFLTLCD